MANLIKENNVASRAFSDYYTYEYYSNHKPSPSAEGNNFLSGLEKALYAAAAAFMWAVAGLARVGSSFVNYFKNKKVEVITQEDLMPQEGQSGAITVEPPKMESTQQMLSAEDFMRMELADKPFGELSDEEKEAKHDDVPTNATATSREEESSVEITDVTEEEYAKPAQTALLITDGLTSDQRKVRTHRQRELQRRHSDSDFRYPAERKQVLSAARSTNQTAVSWFFENRSRIANAVLSTATLGLAIAAYKEGYFTDLQTSVTSGLQTAYTGYIAPVAEGLSNAASALYEYQKGFFKDLATDAAELPAAVKNVTAKAIDGGAAVLQAAQDASAYVSSIVNNPGPTASSEYAAGTWIDTNGRRHFNWNTAP